MRFKGRLNGISKDLSTNEFKIEIRASEDVTKAYHKLNKEADLDIEIKKHRERRTLDANSYYWALVGKVADLIGDSRAYIHNQMLRRHPRIELYDDRPVEVLIPETDAAQKKVDESETYHLNPTSILEYGKNGELYRRYEMLRGSHEYDTKEMAILIDDIIAEAKELGIETLPPAEIERMKREWGVEIA